MTPEQQAAFINAAAARAVIRAMGMQAENEISRRREEYPAHSECDFLRVIDEEGIGHNDIIVYFQQLEIQVGAIRTWTSTTGTGLEASDANSGNAI